MLSRPSMNFKWKRISPHFVLKRRKPWAQSANGFFKKSPFSWRSLISGSIEADGAISLRKEIVVDLRRPLLHFRTTHWFVGRERRDNAGFLALISFLSHRVGRFACEPIGFPRIGSFFSPLGLTAFRCVFWFRFRVVRFWKMEFDRLITNRLLGFRLSRIELVDSWAIGFDLGFTVLPRVRFDFQFICVGFLFHFDLIS